MLRENSGGKPRPESGGSDCAAAKAKLRRYWLEHGVKGPGDDAAELKALLFDYFPCVDGLNDTRMASRKLYRIENPRFISEDQIAFSIKRHGAAALGSAYSEIQNWEIDLISDTAKSYVAGHKKIRPTALPFTKNDAAGLANRVFTNIENRKEDDGGITFLPDGRVAIRIGHYVPGSGPAETVAGRRKRFRSALNEEGERRGWKPAAKAHGNQPTFIQT